MHSGITVMESLLFYRTDKELVAFYVHIFNGTETFKLTIENFNFFVLNHYSKSLLFENIFLHRMGCDFNV
jgi:hypothetical protein